MNAGNREGFYGWAGTLLCVDLTTRKITREPLDEGVATKFLGGDGLGAKLLFDRVPVGTDPMAPENVFILATGPFSGTLFPSSGRLSVVFKSPVSDLIGLSNSGGYLAPEIKWAGYDAIVITGRAERPVWLWIDNDSVEIRSADALWGQDTWQTIEAIRAAIGDERISTMVIGPAGENLVRDALALVNHARAPGKGGSGAVMGSKNLKAIAVRGTRGVRVQNPEQFAQGCLRLHQSIKTSPMYESWATYGTQGFYSILEEVQGVLPTRNFQQGMFPEGRQSLSAETFHRDLSDRTHFGCYGCPVQCSHFLSVKTGKYQGTKIEGIEFYGHFCFGPNLGVPNWGFVAKCHEVCTKLGLQYGIANVMAWAAELYQEGILTLADTDGLDLTWGNEEAFLELLHRIAYRQKGIGDILAGDFETAAKRIGRNSEKYQAVITRLYTSECPRARLDVALSHLISNRGGDHNKATPYFTWITPPEYTDKMVPGLPGDAANMYSAEGKPELIEFSENAHAVIDSLGTCVFPSFFMMPHGGVLLEDYAELLTCATGVAYDRERLLQTGRRITALERCFNIREGYDRSLYQMSEKWYETAVPDGPQKGIKADRAVMDKLVDDFLKLKGFDAQTGFPTRAELRSLDLPEVVAVLDRAQRVVG